MMKLLNVSKSALAAGPLFWSQCFHKYSKGKIESRCFSQKWVYVDGRSFPHDVDDLEEARELVKWADVVLVHNKPPTELQLPREKVILVCHSEPAPNFIDQELLTSRPFAVIAQHHPRFYKGRDFSLVPNMIDLEEMTPVKRSGLLKVGYSPSSLITVKRSDPRWPWQKGCGATVKVLKELTGVIEWKVWIGIPWDELSAQAPAWDVWVDECVTGSYHRCSLQAASLGQVPINNLSAEVAENMSKITGTGSHPFALATLRELPSVLRGLAKDVEFARGWGQRSREWMLEYWNPTKLIEDHFLPFFEKV